MLDKDLVLRKLWQLDSSTLPYDFFSTYEDVVKNYKLLKSIAPNQDVLKAVTGFILDKLEDNKRFRKEYLIKVILNNLNKDRLDEQTVNRLYEVFIQLICIVNEDLAWKVSVILKDVELSDQNIEDLIKHWEGSVHIQNRILRYPSSNKLLARWAFDRLNNKELENRKSELIGLVLNKDIAYSKFEKTEAMIWGIHYSKLNDKNKKTLLVNNFDESFLGSYLEVCYRNGFKDLIIKLL